MAAYCLSVEKNMFIKFLHRSCCLQKASAILHLLFFSVVTAKCISFASEWDLILLIAEGFTVIILPLNLCSQHNYIHAIIFSFAFFIFLAICSSNRIRKKLLLCYAMLFYIAFLEAMAAIGLLCICSWAEVDALLNIPVFCWFFLLLLVMSFLKVFYFVLSWQDTINVSNSAQKHI